MLHERRRSGQRHLEVDRRRRHVDAARKGGLPDEPLGRIGLDVNRRRPNILYATVEGQSPSAAARGGAAGSRPDEAPQRRRPRRAPSRSASMPDADAASTAPTMPARRGSKVNNENAAADVFQPGARSIPTIPRSCSTPASSCTRSTRRRQDGHAQRRRRRSTTTCTRSGSIRRTRTT